MKDAEFVQHVQEWALAGCAAHPGSLSEPPVAEEVEAVTTW